MKRPMIALLLIATLPAALLGQEEIVTPTPEIAEMLSEVEERSPTFREALDAVRADESLSLVVTAGMLPGEYIGVAFYGDGDHTRVNVSLDLGKIAEHKLSREQVQEILVHEIYGHAVPYLMTRGQLCRDPGDGEPYRRSCVAKREAVVMRELGLQPRQTYAILP
jgi:hypothetical protein